MTILEALKFAAKIQIGSRIQGHGNEVLIVKEIGDKYIKGISEYCLNKFNKEQIIHLSYETLLNPHYNKSIKILN